jgi:hypothetical protein
MDQPGVRDAGFAQLEDAQSGEVPQIDHSRVRDLGPVEVQILNAGAVPKQLEIVVAEAGAHTADSREAGGNRQTAAMQTARQPLRALPLPPDARVQCLKSANDALFHGIATIGQTGYDSTDAEQREDKQEHGHADTWPPAGAAAGRIVPASRFVLVVAKHS